MFILQIPPQLPTVHDFKCVAKIWCLFPDIVKNPSWYESLNEKFRVPVPHKFKIDDNSTKYEELACKIKNFYFGNDSLSEDTWSKLADVCSKRAYSVESQQPTDTEVRSSNITFFLSFIVTPGSSLGSLRLSKCKLRWACLQFPFTSIVLLLMENQVCFICGLDLIVCQVSLPQTLTSLCLLFCPN